MFSSTKDSNARLSIRRVFVEKILNQSGKWPGTPMTLEPPLLHWAHLAKPVLIVVLMVRSWVRLVITYLICYCQMHLSPL